MAYNWPGNVRELENVLRNVVVLHDADQVCANMLPLPLLGPPQMPQPSTVHCAPAAQTTKVHTIPNQATEDKTETSVRPLWVEEKAIIERAISLCQNNIPKAAALLEISASTIYRKRTAWEKAEKNLQDAG